MLWPIPTATTTRCGVTSVAQHRKTKTMSKPQNKEVLRKNVAKYLRAQARIVHYLTENISDKNERVKIKRVAIRAILAAHFGILGNPDVDKITDALLDIEFVNTHPDLPDVSAWLMSLLDGANPRTCCLFGFLHDAIAGIIDQTGGDNAHTELNRYTKRTRRVTHVLGFDMFNPAWHTRLLDHCGEGDHIFKWRDDCLALALLMTAEFLGYEVDNEFEKHPFAKALLNELAMNNLTRFENTPKAYNIRIGVWEDAVFSIVKIWCEEARNFEDPAGITNKGLEEFALVQVKLLTGGKPRAEVKANWERLIGFWDVETTCAGDTATKVYNVITREKDPAKSAEFSKFIATLVKNVWEITIHLQMNSPFRATSAEAIAADVITTYCLTGLDTATKQEFIKRASKAWEDMVALQRKPNIKITDPQRTVTACVTHCLCDLLVDLPTNYKAYRLTLLNKFATDGTLPEVDHVHISPDNVVAIEMGPGATPSKPLASEKKSDDACQTTDSQTGKEPKEVKAYAVGKYLVTLVESWVKGVEGDPDYIKRSLKSFFDIEINDEIIRSYLYLQKHDVKGLATWIRGQAIRHPGRTTLKILTSGDLYIRRSDSGAVTFLRDDMLKKYFPDTMFKQIDPDKYGSAFSDSVFQMNPNILSSTDEVKVKSQLAATALWAFRLLFTSDPVIVKQLRPLFKMFIGHGLKMGGAYLTDLPLHMPMLEEGQKGARDPAELQGLYRPDEYATWPDAQVMGALSKIRTFNSIDGLNLKLSKKETDYLALKTEVALFGKSLFLDKEKSSRFRAEWMNPENDKEVFNTISNVLVVCRYLALDYTPVEEAPNGTVCTVKFNFEKFCAMVERLYGCDLRGYDPDQVRCFDYHVLAYLKGGRQNIE